jgi:hypothetical protein
MSVLDPQVKFIHIRNRQPSKKDPMQQEISCRGGVTIAYTVMEAAEAPDGFHITYSSSHCHQRDNYDRRIGRAKAGGRLHSKKVPPKTINICCDGEKLNPVTEILKDIGYPFSKPA